MARTAVDHIFETYDIKEFINEMDTRNQASVRLAQGLNATFAETLPKVKMIRDE